MTDLEEHFIPAFYQLIGEDGEDIVFEDGSIFMCEYPSPVKYPSMVPT